MKKQIWIFFAASLILSPAFFTGCGQSNAGTPTAMPSQETPLTNDADSAGADSSGVANSAGTDGTDSSDVTNSAGTDGADGSGVTNSAGTDGADSSDVTNSAGTDGTDSSDVTNSTGTDGTDSSGTAAPDRQSDDVAASTDAAKPAVTEITISAVGDVTLGVNQKSTYPNSFDEYYDKYGADYFLQNVRDVFEADDFTIVNLEGPLTNSDNIRTTKEWNHRGRPEYVSILTQSSVEAVSLGNNHIMDYQSDGVADTLKTVGDAGIAYALNGIWGNQLGYYETKGIGIGFVSVNEYYDGAAVYQYLEDGINTLREQGADLVFACLHWGGDKVYKLEDEQYEMGHWCIDAGYDLVIGCHPHVIQGIECYNGKYIVYSMGNFCYGGSKNPKDKDSMIFTETFTFVDGVLSDDTSVRVIPCRLSSRKDANDYCPVILEGEEAQVWADHLNSYSKEFGLQFDAEGYIIKDGP